MPIEDFEYRRLVEMERQYSARQSGDPMVEITSRVQTSSCDGQQSQVYSAQIFSGVNKPFIMFSCIPEDTSESSLAIKAVTPVEKFIKNNRLKFHFSLPENDEVMRASGWMIIFKHLTANNISAFKIVRPSLIMSADAEQRGRDVTIYADADFAKTPQEWFVLIQNICNDLVRAGIKDYYQAVNSGRTGQTEVAKIPGVKIACYGYEGLELPAPNDDVCYGFAVNLLAKENEPRDYSAELTENPSSINTP